jgi:hypothetical protein
MKKREWALAITVGALLAVGIFGGKALADRRHASFAPSTPSNGLAWPNAVAITTDSVYRYVTSNGIPDHTVGQFPNAHNPNSIAPQSYSFRLPLNPQIAASTSAITNATLAAVAVNGVPFDPGTAEYWHNDMNSGWHYEALGGGINLGVDDNTAHVQPTGAYHYHGMPTGLITNLHRGQSLTQIGWMADGFPLYAKYGTTDPFDTTSATKVLTTGWRVKSGTRSSGPGGTYDGTFEQDWEFVSGLGDLDSCNGRMGRNLDGTVSYQYYVTDAYPWIPRCTVGTIDQTFRRGR